jgi:hypothetical protein
MKTAIVLGNGVSRKGICCSKLSQFGFTYACNSAYTEFTPTVLVSTDKPIADYIQNTGYALSNRFYTRRPNENTGALELPYQYRRFSSGPNALALAALDGCTDIYLLGFDIGPTQDNLFNNIYAGTEFYKGISSPPTHTGNWIKQVFTVIKDFSDRRFTRVYGDSTKDIEELRALSNLQNIRVETFLKKIETI